MMIQIYKIESLIPIFQHINHNKIFIFNLITRDNLPILFETEL